MVYSPNLPAELLATCEPRSEVLARLTEFYDDLFPPQGSERPSILRNGEANITVLVVTHSGPIEAYFQDIWPQKEIGWAAGLEDRAKAIKYRVSSCLCSTSDRSAKY